MIILFPGEDSKWKPPGSPFMKYHVSAPYHSRSKSTTSKGDLGEQAGRFTQGSIKTSNVWSLFLYTFTWNQNLQRKTHFFDDISSSERNCSLIFFENNASIYQKVKIYLCSNKKDDFP